MMRRLIYPNPSKTTPDRHAPSNGNVKTLVLAVGNPLRGDDGAGIEIVASLATQPCLPKSIDLLDGGIAGMKTLSLLEGYDRVFIVDTADLGLNPGEWVCLTLDQLIEHAESSVAQVTMHNAGLVDALIIGRVLDILPKTISIYAIQPLETDRHMGLSSVVRRSIPAICESIITEVDGIG